MKKLSLVLLLSAFLLVPELRAQELNIETIRFGTDVQNRKLVNADTAFAAKVGSVYCFTQVTGARDSTEITHIWYHKEEEKARVSLSVQSDDWHTWSSKRILPSWTGKWRVMVEDAGGNVIATHSFLIREKEKGQ